MLHNTDVSPFSQHTKVHPPPSYVLACAAAGCVSIYCFSLLRIFACSRKNLHCATCHFVPPGRASPAALAAKPPQFFAYLLFGERLPHDRKALQSRKTLHGLMAVLHIQHAFFLKCRKSLPLILMMLVGICFDLNRKNYTNVAIKTI